MQLEDYMPFLAGQVMTALDLPALLQHFQSAGLKVHIRESVHYTNGHYLQVDHETGHLTFDYIDDKEYLVEGNADVLAEIDASAARVSKVLSELGLKHRFEIYSGNDQLASYFHYDWPHQAI